MRAVDSAGRQIPLDAEAPLPAPTPKRARKVSRPTTPELEALYFQVAMYLTPRETALFMYAMGRATMEVAETALKSTGNPA